METMLVETMHVWNAPGKGLFLRGICGHKFFCIEKAQDKTQPAVGMHGFGHDKGGMGKHMAPQPSDRWSRGLDFLKTSMVASAGETNRDLAATQFTKYCVAYNVI